MIFAGFTSAFLVQKGKGGAWTAFDIPAIFRISTMLILLSSVFLQAAHIANKKQHKLMTSVGLFFTFVLGLLFCYFQVQGWKQLNDAGIYLSFNPNPAGPYFLVITFIHSVILLRRAKSNEILDEIETTEKGILNIRTDLLTLFWHFMGILWVYLYIFLTVKI
jgi:cytochrome c oxidase subunit 3